MQSIRKYLVPLGLGSAILAACGGAAPAAVVPATTTPARTAVVPATATPARSAAAPTRTAPPATAVASATNAATTTPELGAWPVPDWRVASPEAQGMDGEHLVQMLEFIRDQQLDLHSVLVTRHGMLVLETYFYPYAADTPHAIYSATKSVSSALVGIAIGEGVIPNVDTPMLHFFPDRTIANVDDRKQRITLEHLLTMSSGLSWRRPPTGGPPPVYAFQNSADPVQFVLDRPVDDNPGTRFFYNSGGSHLLSAIVQASTQQTALTYARQKLWEPLGITDVAWQADATGVNDGGTGIWLRPRDMARFGLLYARRGVWNEQQIIPAIWVDVSTRQHMPAPKQPDQGYPPSPNVVGYGYQWWVNALGGYSAIGFGEQEIIVLPEHDLVIVMTGTFAEGGAVTPEDLTRQFIVPAVTSSAPLSDTPAVARRLAELSHAAAAPPQRAVVPLPTMAQQIGGKTYRVQTPDGRQAETFTLTFAPEAGAASFTGMINGKEVIVAVGVDGVDRRTETPTGTVLARGRWTDDHTFAMDHHVLGEAVDEEATFVFDDARVTASYRSVVYGNVVTVEGEQIEP